MPKKPQLTVIEGGKRSGSNRFATMSRQRTAPKKAKARRKLDDYETPFDAVAVLKPYLDLRGRRVLEPCAGSGRIVKALRQLYGKTLKIESADIKRGQNFLSRTKRFLGDCVTNPPYNKGQAEAFARHALKLCDGRVAMLMQTGWLTGDRRTKGMFLAGLRPERVIMIPWRIMFIDGDGKEIDGQFFNHCWVIWPPRGRRDGNTKTVLEFASPRAA